MSLKEQLARARRELWATALAVGDPRTPLLARVLASVVFAYALSPIDLIPDFIPVLGLLDDALLIPLGIWLVLKLLPPVVIDEARARVEAGERPQKRAWGALLVIASWAALIALGAWLWATYG